VFRGLGGRTKSLRFSRLKTVEAHAPRERQLPPGKGIEVVRGPLREGETGYRPKLTPICGVAVACYGYSLTATRKMREPICNRWPEASGAISPTFKAMLSTSTAPAGEAFSIQKQPLK